MVGFPEKADCLLCFMFLFLLLAGGMFAKHTQMGLLYDEICTELTFFILEGDTSVCCNNVTL